MQQVVEHQDKAGSAVSLPVDIAARVKRLAKDDRRSVSQWLSITIDTAVEAAEKMRGKRLGLEK